MAELAGGAGVSTGAGGIVMQAKQGPLIELEGDAHIVRGLRNGDEDAFISCVRRYNGSLTRVARMYVPNAEVADEVVQETWLALIEGIHRFEGRSSLKTWLFRILVNLARRRGMRERRTIPFSQAWEAEAAGEPSVDPDRFLPIDAAKDPRHWRPGSEPRVWTETPEERLLSHETLKVVRDAIASLPPAQREVIYLRDVEGLTGREVCDLLELTENNQRVLLHRARTKVRSALAQYFGDDLERS